MPVNLFGRKGTSRVECNYCGRVTEWKTLTTIKRRRQMDRPKEVYCSSQHRKFANEGRTFRGQGGVRPKVFRADQRLWARDVLFQACQELSLSFYKDDANRIKEARALIDQALYILNEGVRPASIANTKARRHPDTAARPVDPFADDHISPMDTPFDEDVLDLTSLTDEELEQFHKDGSLPAGFR